MQNISKATEYNWRKLNSNTSARLKSRANKTASTKKIIASSYLSDRRLTSLSTELMQLNAPLRDIIYTLCVEALRQAEIINSPHVKDFLSTQKGNYISELNIPYDTFGTDSDILGFLYQSLVEEGRRNLAGIYYTNADVVDHLYQHIETDEHTAVLDPCCGSGAFLMRCPNADPQNLYGYDIDPMAVLIASTNLLIKFKDKVFKPQIYYRDFLDCDIFGYYNDSKRFDLIITNPPWGADRTGTYRLLFPQISSGERASMTILRSMSMLSTGGRACFVLPTSILTTDTHADIRRHILEHFSIERLDMFSNRFDGVFTKFFALEIKNLKPEREQVYTLCKGEDIKQVSIAEKGLKNGEIKIKASSTIDQSIISKIEAIEHTSLSGSRFALGIVTGDNKRLLLDQQVNGSEPIYMGKNVETFRLNNSGKYIVFKRESFQQCAPEECFRAQEKLIYRFIAKYPIVAYDDSCSLTLNSANIIIPQLEGISAKSICALLNSSAIRFYYSTKFHDIKVLKKNLCALPIPRLTEEQDRVLSDLSAGYEQLDYEIFALFGITRQEQDHIKRELYKS